VNAKANEYGPPTERELEILKILWERGRASVREVYEEMRRSAPIVQNTIQAFLRTMEDKGLVASRQQDPPAEAGGLPRRLYAPTALGRRFVQAHAQLAKLLPEFAR